jgi:hypothetical protein
LTALPSASLLLMTTPSDDVSGVCCTRSSGPTVVVSAVAVAVQAADAASVTAMIFAARVSAPPERRLIRFSPSS